MFGVSGAGFQRGEHDFCQAERNHIRCGLAGGYNAPANTAGTAGVDFVHVAGLVAVLYVGGRSAYSFHHLKSAFPDKERGEIEDFLRTTPFENLVSGGQTRDLARTLCIKRLEFLHEREVRLLYHDAESKEKCDVFVLAFDYDKALDHVMLDPRLDTERFEALKADLIRLGCKLRIMQSDLYKVGPTINIMDFEG